MPPAASLSVFWKVAMGFLLTMHCSGLSQSMSHSPCGAPKGKTETVKCAQSADFEKLNKIKKVPLFCLHQEQNVYNKHAFHLSRSGKNVMVWLSKVSLHDTNRCRVTCTYDPVAVFCTDCGSVILTPVCVCVCVHACVHMCDLGVAVWLLEIWIAYIKLQIIQVLLLVVVIVILCLRCPSVGVV